MLRARPVLPMSEDPLQEFLRNFDVKAFEERLPDVCIQTTMRYDHRGEEAKKQAAELLHTPYVKSVS